MAKMNDVKYGVPENFLSGLGQYSYDDMLMDAALGFAAASEDDILMGLSGLGRMARPGQQFNVFVKMNDAQLRAFVQKNPMNMQARQELVRRMGRVRPPSGGKPPPFMVALPKPPPPPGKPKSVMDAIIANAKELNAKKAVVAQVQKQAAAVSPVVAIALAKKKQQTSMPGANETRGIIAATNMAAKKALMAKKDEAKARQLLAQSDKRGAAAAAVSALTKAREAAITANKAEKTRLARGLDLLANTLTAQADYLDSLVKAEAARSGQSPRSMALSATAQSLREQVKRIKAQSGVVAAMPNVPANAPSQQRIADLANKFNIRTAKKDKFMLDKATVSVLGDLAEDPMAQVSDYEGALSYYGVDGLGQMMADMEFDNFDAAISGLSGLMGGIGYTDTTPILAQSDDVLAAASALATTTYNEVIVPASGLSGLGALGGAWEDWCEREVPAAKATPVGRAYAGDVKKCQKWGPAAPWSTAGILFRGGNVDLMKVISEAPKAIAKAVEDVKKVGGNVQQAVQSVTGQKPKPAPAATKPPVQVPATPKPTPVQAAVTQAKEVAENVAITTKEAFVAPAAGGVPGYVYIAAGAALIGGYWFFLRPKSAAV